MIVDYENLSESKLITQLILEMKGKGHMLPYDDYLIINKWVGLCQNKFVLYGTLQKELSNYFGKEGNKTKSLKSIDRKISNLLKSHR